MSSHSTEVKSGERFEFGANWAAYLADLDDSRIETAVLSLTEKLETSSLAGKRFLDIGSGSGLFSLSARKLGAHVTSFDFDPASVACTNYLRQHFFADDPHWRIMEGSVLDEAFLNNLGEFDLVYSWGVLHHTGQMWRALDNAVRRVAPHGILYIAIYNDQGGASRRWLAVKKAYNALPRGLKWLVLWPSFVRLWGPSMVRDLMRGKPAASWREVQQMRGMHPWRDVVDWVGGLPFEVATPEAIFDFCRSRGFVLDRLKTCGGGLGCNEFVFHRVRSSA
jgi:2-polyprenyl-6-hydroxyphenyl methylase/3-demethylubiquinone-9 3-methyltransferase